jgi:hypothetical protein
VTVAVMILSKAEKLGMSTICPVCLRKRTSDLRVNEYTPEMALGSLRACSPQSAAD